MTNAENKTNPNDLYSPRLSREEIANGLRGIAEEMQDLLNSAYRLAAPYAAARSRAYWPHIDDLIGLGANPHHASIMNIADEIENDGEEEE